MFKDYALLPTHHLAKDTSFYHPENISTIIHLETPALQVFTDFHVRPPEMIDRNKLASEALEKMKNAGVKGLMVVDSNEHTQGFISSLDIAGMKRTRAAQENSVKPAEVTVAMLMTPTSSLNVIDFKDLNNARVGHIARLLHELDLQHILVYEINEGSESIARGIFSRSRISRQLGVDIGLDLGSHSVADMNRRI